jgi:hypothetical protein
MFQRELNSENLMCPECGAKLATERDLYVCKDHGAFFAYGPQLLVRAPRPSLKQPADSVLPWEKTRASLV